MTWQPWSAAYRIARATSLSNRKKMKRLGRIGQHLTPGAAADDHAAGTGTVTRTGRSSQEGTRFERIVRIGIIIDEVKTAGEGDIRQREIIVFGPPGVDM